MIMKIFASNVMVVNYRKSDNIGDYNLLCPHKVILLHIHGRVAMPSQEILNSLVKFGSHEKQFTLWGKATQIAKVPNLFGTVVLEIIWDVKRIPNSVDEIERIQQEVSKDVLSCLDPGTLDEFAFVVFVPLDSDMNMVKLLEQTEDLEERETSVERELKEASRAEIEGELEASVAELIAPLESRLSHRHLKMLLSLACLCGRSSGNKISSIEFLRSLKILATFQPGYWSQLGAGTFAPFSITFARALNLLSGN
eukprot:Gregarina_sp_Poly_1__7078@NODE_386_length_9004_cov_34_917534_g315_i0_p4_GENE_NODE_386_length_9004_cov_34_917534_g315_i0NODE_386_length_9004_cov_34_917534_g315_i0_p4_ORF_typecomplete_len253_score35_32FTH/PF01827_27/0_2FTH/PF01827_27/8_3e03DUF5588/PF17826_1/0_14_NODE_386_length_9004_cov_34_917534_g315_i039744732